MIESTQTGTDTVSQIRAAWINLDQRWANFRKRQVRNYGYVIGQMLDEDVKKALRADGRPILEFQLLQQPILYVAGKLKRDGTKMKATPIHGGATDDAFLHTVLVSDWAMETSNGYNEIAKAALDAAIGGIGWTNNYYSTRRDPEGSWCTSRAHPLAVMFDPEVLTSDQREAWRFMTYSMMYSAEEILKIYERYLTPEQVEKIKQSAANYEGQYKSTIGRARSWVQRVASSVLSKILPGQADRFREGLMADMVDARDGLYRVIEWHDRRTVSTRYMYSPSTRAFEEIPKDLDNDDGIRSIAQKTRKAPTGEDIPLYPDPIVHVDSQELLFNTVVVPALLPDAPIFERPYEVQGRGFQFKPIFCHDFHFDITEVQSIVDPQITPIDFHNQRLMTALEVAMDSVNPPIDAPAGSIDEADKNAWESKKRGVLRFFTAQLGESKPTPRRPDPQVFTMLKALAEEGRSLQEWMSGISPNARGFQESSGESGYLFNQRAKESERMLSHFFGNVQESMKEIFGYADASIQKMMPFPRMIRILGDSDDPMWLPVNWPTLQGLKNDITQGEYDFRPDTQAIGETAKAANLMLLMEVVKMTPPEFVPWHMIYDRLDIPGAKDFARYISQKLGFANAATMEQAQLKAAAGKLAIAQRATGAGQPTQAEGKR